MSTKGGGSGRGSLAATASDPEQARRTLSGGVLIFRWLAFAWMLAINATRVDLLRRPVLAWLGVAAAGVWTVWLTLTRNAHRTGERPWVLAVDLALSSALILLSGLVERTGAVSGLVETRTGVQGPTLFYATAYPLSTALAWGTSWGIAGALESTAVLGVAVVLSRPLNGVPLASLNRSQWLLLVNGMVNYLLAAGVAGVVSRYIDRSARRLRAAIDDAMLAREHAARLSEHKKLARQIHDSVLQGLALINKRGHEMAENAASNRDQILELGEVAAEHEKELRSLILREPEVVPAGSSSLRDALETAARTVSPLPVTVSAVGSIFLPTQSVEQLTGAVEQALENVVEHAQASRAAIFAERDDEWVTVSVRDDGCGFVYSEDQLRGAGKAGMLGSMKGRIEELGGRMKVQTAPGAGTEVEFRVPVDAHSMTG